MDFVDLRINRDAGVGGDNFWPSFTDIMAVVVMIFLIATSILVLRNWELIRQITATMEAEKQAAELARSTRQENATLEEQLAQTEHQLSMTRLELLRIEAEQKNYQQRITQQESSISQLENEQSRLKQTLTEAETDNQRLNALLEKLMAEFSLLQSQQQETVKTLEETRDSLLKAQAENQKLSDETARALQGLNEMTTLSQAQQTQLEELRKNALSHQESYSTLQSDYDELKTKYDRLIKPARTAVGKYVVEVRYLKSGNDYLIDLREPNERNYRRLDKQQLHSVLSKLRDTHPETLYVKLIFPEDSGLSYSEAWEFTQQLLSQYDYYHRLR